MSRKIDALVELEKLAKAATPGPWKLDMGNWQVEAKSTRDGICGITLDQRDRTDGTPNPIDPYDDGLFIAAANPETVLKLIAVVRAAPEGCICHVKAADGYHGTNHADWCDTYTKARYNLLEGGTND